MTNPTDTQLKRALAKMLPKFIYREKVIPNGYHLYWMPSGYPIQPKRVCDTELLHVCWLIEETLTMGQRLDYLNYLDNRTDDDWLTSHATWQQRVIALAKIKNIKI